MVDTSVIIDNPELNLVKLSENSKNNIFITDIVLKELEKHKISLRNDLSFAAREFFRLIKDSKFKKISKRKLNKIKIRNIDNVFEVILTTENNNKIPLFIISRKKYENYDVSSNDSKIIEVAKDYNLKCITNDTSFKIFAKTKGLKAETLYWDQVNNPEKIDFLKEYEILDKEDLNKIYENEKKWNQIHIHYKENYNGQKFLNGKEDFFLVNGNGLIPLDMSDEYFQKKYTVPPINIEQKFYTHLLESPVNILTVTGSTGSGKTLMALQAGMNYVKDKNSSINGIIYMRFTINAEDKFSALGYRKGDENLKLSYFNYPLIGALNFIAEKKLNLNGEDLTEVQTIQRTEQTNKFIEDYNIEFLDIAHARGITLTNKFIIFDESQNTPNNILKLMGTRVGSGSKIIFLGDFNQVDHPYLNKEKNSLVSLLNKSLVDPFIAGIKLKHTVRSDVAKWFQENI